MPHVHLLPHASPSKQADKQSLCALTTHSSQFFIALLFNSFLNLLSLPCCSEKQQPQSSLCLLQALKQEKLVPLQERNICTHSDFKASERSIPTAALPKVGCGSGELAKKNLPQSHYSQFFPAFQQSLELFHLFIQPSCFLCLVLHELLKIGGCQSLFSRKLLQKTHAKTCLQQNEKETLSYRQQKHML